MLIKIKNIKNVGRLTSYILDYIAPYIDNNTSTENINIMCNNEILKYNAFPATLYYNLFPKSVCISVNNIVCHGIPHKNIRIHRGDLINVDITTILNNWYGDSSRNYYVGVIKYIYNRMSIICHESLTRSITIISYFKYFNIIGKIICSYIHKFGYSSVREYCGHGIGNSFHSMPNILHYYNYNVVYYIKNNSCFTIEPMINLGSWKTMTLNNNWQSTTLDFLLSVQFEHTILRVYNSYNSITKSFNNLCNPYYTYEQGKIF